MRARLALCIVALGFAAADEQDMSCARGCENPTAKSVVEFSQYDEIDFSGFRDKIHDAVGRALTSGEALLKVEEMFCTEVITHPHRRVVSEAGNMDPSRAALITVPITVEDDDTSARSQKCVAIDIFFRDVDECTSKEHPHACSANSVCVNTIGSYECQCAPGYEHEDPANAQSPCVDVDECSLADDVCAHVRECAECVNTPGAFRCALREEARDMYVDAPTGNVTECTARDVCAELDPCGEAAVCHSSTAAPFFRCECKPEYHDRSPGQDGTLCIPRGICEKHGHACSARAQCKACQEASPAARARGSRCLDSGIVCECRDPFFGDGIGEEGCQKRYDPETAELSEDGETAVCKPGFTPRVGDDGWDRHAGPGCVDIDECAVDFAAQRAVGNTQYLNTVTHQPTGYQFTPCNPLATCTNTHGDFVCKCREDIAQAVPGLAGRGEEGCATDLLLVPRAEFEFVSDVGRHTRFRTTVKQLSAFRDDGVTVRHRSEGAVADSSEDLMDVIRSQLRTARDFVAVETAYHPRLRHRASVMESVGYLPAAINYTLYQGSQSNRRVHHLCTVDVEILDADETVLPVQGEVGETDLVTYDGTVIPAQFAPQCDARAHCTNTNGSYACACATGYAGFSCAASVLADWEAGLYRRTPFRSVYKPQCLRDLEAAIEAAPARRDAIIDAARRGCVARGAQRFDIIGARARVIEDCRCSEETVRIRDTSEAMLCGDNDRAERVAEVQAERDAAAKELAVCRRAARSRRKVDSPHACRARAAEAECMHLEAQIAFLDGHIDTLVNGKQACHAMTCTDGTDCSPSVTSAHLNPDQLVEFAGSCLDLGVDEEVCARVRDAVGRASCSTASCGNGIAVQQISYHLNGQEVAARFAVTIAVDVLQRVQDLVGQTMSLEADSSIIAREVRKALQSTATLDAEFKDFVTNVFTVTAVLLIFLAWYFGVFASAAAAVHFFLNRRAITDHDAFMEGHRHYSWWCKRGASGIQVAREGALEFAAANN